MLDFSSRIRPQCAPNCGGTRRQWYRLLKFGLCFAHWAKLPSTKCLSPFPGKQLWGTMDSLKLATIATLINLLSIYAAAALDPEQPRPIIAKAAKEFAEARKQTGTAGAQAIADECLGRLNKIPSLDLAGILLRIGLPCTPTFPLEEQAELNRINYTIRKMGPGISKLHLTKDRQGKLFTKWLIAARTEYAAYPLPHYRGARRPLFR